MTRPRYCIMIRKSERYGWWLPNAKITLIGLSLPILNFFSSQSSRTAINTDTTLQPSLQSAAMDFSGPYCDVCSQSGLTLILPCTNCRWCIDCIQSHFTLAIKDKTMWPPTCCSDAPIPISSVQGMLTPDRYATVLRRAQDWALLTTPPIYCAKPSCSKHLNPSSGQISPTIDNNISCPDCQTQTCTACKMLSHDGPCQPDTVREQLLALKYAPCPFCGNMIELIAGCQVITCVEPCNRKFCYLCHRLLNKCRRICEASWAFAMEHAD